MPKKKVRLRIDAWSVVERALEEGLGFALNRLADAGAVFSDEQREAAMPNMLNEIGIALEEVVDWEKSG